MDLFKNEGITILFKDDLEIILYHPEFYSLEESNNLFDKINEQTSWKRDKIKMYGNYFSVPRDTAWYGEKSYTYSNIYNAPSPWTETLKKIKEDIEVKCNTKFNSLLLNRYQTGDDKVDWHADDEPELDKNSPIASLSLGSDRDFLIREKGTSGNNIKQALQNGSLLIMNPPTQELWEHSVPKRKNVGARINLTFRNVI